MLVRNNRLLVPHDMDQSLLDFIIKDEGKSRFVIGIHIPEATHGMRYYYDTVHIATQGTELLVHSQRNSRNYQLHMYAWEHVYCLMPSAQAKRKKGTGWISRDAVSIVAEPDFASSWYSKPLLDFIGKYADDNP
jgi:hypothetical protein